MVADPVQINAARSRALQSGPVVPFPHGDCRTGRLLVLFRFDVPAAVGRLAPQMPCELRPHSNDCGTTRTIRLTHAARTGFGGLHDIDSASEAPGRVARCPSRSTMTPPDPMNGNRRKDCSPVTRQALATRSAGRASRRRSGLLRKPAPPQTSTATMQRRDRLETFSTRAGLTFLRGATRPTPSAPHPQGVLRQLSANEGIHLPVSGSSPTVTISDVTALPLGSFQTHFGTSMPSGSSQITPI